MRRIVPLIGVLIISLGFVEGIREGWFFLPEVQVSERFADEARISFVAFGRQAVDQDEAKVLAAHLETLSLGTGPFAFVLLLGDNFFPDGVNSVSDPVWQSQFFDVYDRPATATP
jgi:hypothetical protein